MPEQGSPVMLDVHQDVIDNLKLFSVQTRCQDKNEFLTRPDLGRRLSEDGVQKVKDQCIEAPDVQLIVADGLSSTAINANIENVLPVLMGWSFCCRIESRYTIFCPIWPCGCGG